VNGGIAPTRRGLCVETFAGWGGLSLGIEQAGFDVQVSVDVEPVNAAVHEYNFGYGRSLTGDMFEDQTKAIRRALPGGEEVDAIVMGRTPESILGKDPDGEKPRLDLVTGGPPCQGISAIGRRDADDPRNRLMDSFIDHGTALGARYMVMEQVPTLLQPQNAEHLDHLREKLHGAGYSMLDPQVLRAVDFGVPQRRERVFLMIHRNDQMAPAYPEPTHSADGSDFFLKRTPTVGDAFDGLADADAFEELWSRDWVHAGFPHPDTWYGRVMTGLENDPDDLSYRRPHRRDLLTCSQLVDHGAESVERFRATPFGRSERTSRRHRLDPDGYSLTLRAGSNAEHGSFTAVMPIHPKGTRQITVREACRLHSVPDWVRLSATKIWAYRQLGNSVPPLLGRAVAREIAKAAGIAPAQPNDVVEFGSEDLLNVANTMTRQSRAA
jgi:DNA (cytosine-5)-methyltransferase 1